MAQEALTTPGGPPKHRAWAFSVLSAPRWSPLSAPWPPVPAAQLYTSSSVVLPAPARKKRKLNRFAIGSLSVAIVGYLVPLVALIGYAEVQSLAFGEVAAWQAIGFAVLVAVGFAITVPLVLVAVVLAIISLKTEDQGRRTGILALVLSGLIVVAALALSVGFLTFVPMPMPA